VDPTLTRGKNDMLNIYTQQDRQVTTMTAKEIEVMLG